MLKKLIKPIATTLEDRTKSMALAFQWLRVKVFPSDEEYMEDFREVFMYEYKGGHNNQSYRKKCIYPKNYDKIVKNGKIRKIAQDGYELEYNGEKYRLLDISGASKCKEEKRRYFTIEDFLIDPKFFVSNTNNENLQLCKRFGLRLQDTPKYLPVFQCDYDDTADKLRFFDDGINRSGKELYKSWNKKENASFFAIRDHNDEMHRWEILKSLGSVPVVTVTACAKMLANIVTLLPIELGKHLILTEQPILQLCGKVLFATGSLIKDSVNFISVLTRAVLVVPLTANREKYADKYWTKLKYQWKKCKNEMKSDWNMVFSSGDINHNSEFINAGDVKKQETQVGGSKGNVKDNKNQENKLMAIDSWDELNGRKNNNTNQPTSSLSQSDQGCPSEEVSQLPASGCRDRSTSSPQSPPRYSGSLPSSPPPSYPGSRNSSPTPDSNSHLQSLNRERMRSNRTVSETEGQSMHPKAKHHSMIPRRSSSLGR